MRPVRVLLAAGALVGLTACPFESTGDCFGAGPGLPAAEPPTRLALLGQPVDVPVTPFRPFTCEEQPLEPEGLTSEVYSPDNRLVPSTAQLQGTSGGTVRFTPDMPGRYHVVAAFEPVGGLNQVGVLAVADRRSESPLTLLPRTCDGVRRTTRGTWLCDSDVVRGNRVAERLGEPSPSLTPRVAVVGDVVWTADTSGVRRYTDTGEAFLPTGQASHGGSRPPDFLLASEGELVALYASYFQRFTFEGGGVVLTGSTAWGPVPVPGLPDAQSQGVLVREGEVLATAAQDGGGPRTRTCTYGLSSGRYTRTAEACQELPGLLAGVEGGAVWTLEDTGRDSTGFPLRTVRRYALARGRMELQGLLELHTLEPQLLPPLRGPTLPLFVHRRLSPPLNLVVTWRPAQRDLVLEVLDSAEFLNPRASPELYWGRLGGSAAVRVRPSPP